MVDFGGVKRIWRKPWWIWGNGVNLGGKEGFGEKQMHLGKSWWVWGNVDLGKMWWKWKKHDLGKNRLDLGKTGQIWGKTNILKKMFWI